VLLNIFVEICMEFFSLMNTKVQINSIYMKYKYFFFNILVFTVTF